MSENEKKEKEKNEVGFFNKKQAAAYLGVSVETLNKFVDDKHVVPQIVYGNGEVKSFRFSKKYLDELNFDASAENVD